MLAQAAAQVAPVVSEARTLDRFIAPTQERLWSLARNLWWSWDHDSTSLFRDLDPIRWKATESQSRRDAGRDSLDGIERRAQNWSCIAGSITHTGGSRSIFARTDLGSETRGHLEASAGSLFFSRIWFARIDSEVFGWIRGSRRRPHQERLGPGHSADRCRLVLWARLFPAAARSERLAARRIPADRHQPLPMEPAIGKNGEPVLVQIETRSGCSGPESGA